MRKVRLDSVALLVMAIFVGGALITAMATANVAHQYEEIIDDYQAIIETSGTTFDTILARYVACEKKYNKQQTIEPAGESSFP